MTQHRATDSYLLRDPSISRRHVAFAYAGDIWVAAREGADACRLTTGGHRAKPYLSPDGSRIAFTERRGPLRGCIHVLPVSGGEPVRLTHHPGDIETVGWSPDGKEVLFSSARASYTPHPDENRQLFTVPFGGGVASPVPLQRASQGSYSPDGTRFAYVPSVQWLHAQDAWKGYRGGQAQPIWIARLCDSTIEEKIPRDDSNDFNPMWIGDTIYFLSDRDGPVTLYAYDLVSRRVEQVFGNDGPDLKSAAATADAIVYEQFGSLHLFDLEGSASRLLSIRPKGEFPETRPYLRKIERKELRFADISPSGDCAAFGVHGRILLASAGGEDIRDLTRASGVSERDPSWSPCGKSIAYFSDQSGEYALHIRDLARHEEVARIDLGTPPGFYYSPTWAPDSSKVGYTDQRLNYWYVDLQERVPVRVDTDSYADPTRGLQLTWSADSQWIAYTRHLHNHLHAVFLYSVARKASYQVTDGMSDALYPVFDKSGRYLYFTASVDLGLCASAHDMTRFNHPVTRRVYAFLLSKNGVPSSRTDSVGDDPHVEPENAMERIVPLPIPPRNYCGLAAGKPGNLFLFEGPAIEPIFGTTEEGPPVKVIEFDWNRGTTAEIARDVASLYLRNREAAPAFRVSFDGEKVLYALGNDWFIDEVRDLRGPSRSSREPLKLTSMHIHVEPRVEWAHMYEQAWRNERDFFYDPELHGADVDALKQRYEHYLKELSSRDDLNYLFAEMLGHLSVSHLFIHGGEAREPARDRAGLLGADYLVENGAFRFARIYRGDTWNPEMRAPLTQPGEVVRRGEYLIAVNGRPLRPRADLYSFFYGTAGRPTELTVGPEPTPEGSRKVIVIPVEDETALRHHAWVEDNRLKVEEVSGGRIAYVYLPDTAAAGYANFNRYYWSQVGKEGAIIDLRYNHGGRFADYVIDQLRRSLLGHFSMRAGTDICVPMEGIFGPKIMLINEMSGSGGDLLPWMFRESGLGRLIGKRTWGGLVGMAFNPNDLLDGGYVATPGYRFYRRDGAWDIENCGVIPDIEVEDDPGAARTGRDVQLEKAIQVVMEQLQPSTHPGNK